MRVFCNTRSDFHMEKTEVDNNAKDIDVVMLMYNLIEYCDNYSKTSGRLCQYCRNEPVINDANDEIFYFNLANAITDSFKFKQKKPRLNR